MNATENKGGIRGRYLLVWIAMCGMIGTSVGMVKNCTGIFFNPIAETYGIGRGAVSLTMTITCVMLALGDLLSARFIGSRHFRKKVWLWSAGVIVPTLLMAVSPNIGVLYLLHVFRAFAGGILGLVISTIIINRWFVRYNSLVTGVVLAVSGLTGALMAPVLSAVIELTNWRIGYLAEAAFMLLFYLPVLFLPVSFAPEDLGLPALGAAEELSQAEETAPASKDREAPADGKPAAGKESAAIPLTLMALMLVYVFMGNCISSLSQHLPGIADSAGFTTAVGAALVSVCMAANAGGKVVMGMLADRFGRKWPAVAYASLIGAGLFLMLTVRTVPAAFLGAVSVGLAFSITTVVASLITKDAFGRDEYSRTFPVISMAGTLSGAAAAPAIGSVYDFTGNYTLAIFIELCFAVTIIALILLIYTRAGRERSI